MRAPIASSHDGRAPSLIPRGWIAAWCLTLVGCGSSPPVRYYTLEAAAVPIGAAAAAGAVGTAPGAPAYEVPLRVEPVAIPRELDRPELVSRSDPYRLRVMDSERWAAPLDDQIRRVLSDDLAAQLPPGMVADPYEPAGDAPRRLLSVTIADLSTDGLCAATLRADWLLQGPKGEILRGTEQFRSSAGPDCTAPIAAAMSAALQTRAERLATAALASGATPPRR